MADVRDVFEWHINADKPDLLKYDTQFDDPGWLASDEYASCGLDPQIIDLPLDGTSLDTLMVV